MPAFPFLTGVNSHTPVRTCAHAGSTSQRALSLHPHMARSFKPQLQGHLLGEASIPRTYKVLSHITFKKMFQPSLSEIFTSFLMPVSCLPHPNCMLHGSRGLTHPPGTGHSIRLRCSTCKYIQSEPGSEDIVISCGSASMIHTQSLVSMAQGPAPLLAAGRGDVTPLTLLPLPHMDHI